MNGSLLLTALISEVAQDEVTVTQALEDRGWTDHVALSEAASEFSLMQLSALDEYDTLSDLIAVAFTTGALFMLEALRQP